MSNLNFLNLLLGLFLLVVGCAAANNNSSQKGDVIEPKAEQSIHVTNVSDVDKLKKTEVQIPWKIVDTEQLKEHLKNQLSKATSLVPDFMPGKLLEEKPESLKYHNINIYRLRKLTGQNLVTLRMLLKPLDSHFGIQTALYWEKIYELQKKGVSIAYFSEANLSQAIAGLYVDSQKLILLRPLGSYATLEHEERHYEQYQQLAKRKSTIKLESSDILTEDCKQKLSLAFGEMDATLYEYRDLKQLLAKLPLANKIPFYVPAIRYHSVTSLPLEDFQYSFNYIITSGERLKEAEKKCPKNLQIFIDKVSAYIDINKYMAVNVIGDVSSRIESVSRFGNRPDIIEEVKNNYVESINNFSKKMGPYLNQLSDIIKSEMEALLPIYRDALTMGVSGLSFYSE